MASPFAALSFIAAPAVLTNAASVLAMSTSNRFLRASDRMRQLADRLDRGVDTEATLAMFRVQVGRGGEAGGDACSMGWSGAHVRTRLLRGLRALVSIVRERRSMPRRSWVARTWR